MTAGFFLFCLPHFTTPVYIAMRNVSNANQVGGFGTDVLCPSQHEQDCGKPTEESLAYYKWVFYLAQFLIGMGATPLYTLAVTYMDENVLAKSSSVYLG
jgi:organic anion transporter 4A